MRDYWARNAVGCNSCDLSVVLVLTGSGSRPTFRYCDRGVALATHHPGRLFFHNPMYLLYIDDSGDDGRSPSSSSHLLLGGLAIRASEWRAMVGRLDGIVAKHLGADRAKTELHGSDILSGRGIYRSMLPPARVALFEEVLQEIGKPDSGVSLFFVVLHKACLPVSRNTRVVATLQLCQRFNAFLTRSGNQEPGLLICDEHAAQGQISSLISVIHSEGLPRQLRDNLIETAFFVKSHESRILQAADVACHAFYRFVTMGDDRFAHLIEDRIVRADERRKKKGKGKPSPVTVHFGFRYIAAQPTDGLARKLPFQRMKVTALTHLPVGSFLNVADLLKELEEHGL